MYNPRIPAKETHSDVSQACVTVLPYLHSKLSTGERKEVCVNPLSSLHFSQPYPAFSHLSFSFLPFIKGACIYLSFIYSHSFFEPPSSSAAPLPVASSLNTPSSSCRLSILPSCLSIHQYCSSLQIASLLYCCAKLTVCLSSPRALNTLNQRLKEIDTLPLR